MSTTIPTPQTMTPMRHIIAILLQNEAGALTRVADGLPLDYVTLASIYRQLSDLIKDVD